MTDLLFQVVHKLVNTVGNNNGCNNVIVVIAFMYEVILCYKLLRALRQILEQSKYCKRTT